MQKQKHTAHVGLSDLLITSAFLDVCSGGVVAGTDFLEIIERNGQSTKSQGKQVAGVLQTRDFWRDRLENTLAVDGTASGHGNEKQTNNIEGACKWGDFQL